MPGSGAVFAVVEIVVFLAAVGAFSHNLWKKILLIKQGKPEWEPRLDQFPERLADVVFEVFGHRRLLRDPVSGLMHLGIFWGFTVLFLSVANFFWEGLTGSALPFTDGHVWYHLTMNVFYLAVTLAWPWPSSAGS